MKGIWGVTTSTINQPIVVTAFVSLLLVVAIVHAIISFIRPSEQWPDARTLQIGLLLISIWSFLHWVDVIIRSQYGSIQYGYIVIQPMFKLVRLSSEIFSIWGLWNVTIRYTSLRPTRANMIYYVWPKLGILILWFLALYHFCMFFTLSLAWLSFADLSVIDYIAGTSSAFEIAYTTVYFIYSAMTAGGLTWLILKAHQSYEDYKTELQWALYASFFLAGRSFCEVIIVGQLDRWPADILSVYAAREMTYSIGTILFAVCVPHSIPYKKSTDPLVEREKDSQERKAVAWLAAEDDVRSWLFQEMVKVTESGTKTAPTVSTLLGGLEDKLDTHDSDDDEYEILAVKRREIVRLRDLYADWQPIFRG
ncbi:hypothetical protein BJ170DRAFT_364280 [Xylariales sp. AK1849]|nr:hypothetical protein BJ170DRAFT_364280 [Xylariales sp. AK1849]